MNRRRMRAGIFLLPNLITATSLFSGFLAMRFAVEGRFLLTASQNVQNFERPISLFVFAAYAILVSTICDGLDGSVARWTHSQSSFGVQFDSLVDMASFGVAPAWIAYNFALYEMGRLGFAACFAYVACTALRLARFNVQSAAGKANGNFTGIPTPMAAIFVVSFVLLQNEMTSWLNNANDFSPWALTFAGIVTSPQVRCYSLLVLVLTVALGMISTFEYISTKSIRLPKKYPFRVLAAVLLTITFLMTWEFAICLAIFSVLYVLHGPFMWIFFKRDRGDEEEELFLNEEEDLVEGSAK